MGYIYCPATLVNVYQYTRITFQKKEVRTHTAKEARSLTIERPSLNVSICYNRTTRFLIAHCLFRWPFVW